MLFPLYIIYLVEKRKKKQNKKKEKRKKKQKQNKKQNPFSGIFFVPPHYFYEK
jgi:hypothetical protein